MKKFITILLIAFFGSVCIANAEEPPVKYKQEGKVFVQNSTRTSISTDKETDYSWKDSKDNKYPIILHQYQKGDNAGKWTCYVIKTSQKTGKTYKYYLPDGDKIAQEIMGR